MEADEQRERGLGAEAARQAARRTFGSPAGAAERTRDAWPGVWLDILGKNIRCCLRRAAHSPGFTATIAGVIALAVGAGTALFSFADITFFKPLPYPPPPRVDWVTGHVQSSTAPGNV